MSNEELVEEPLLEEETLVEEEIEEEVIEEEVEEEVVEEELVEEEVAQDEPLEEAPEEEAGEDEQVEEHLKDSVAGSLRLKRMMEQTTSNAPNKRARTDAESTKIKMLMTKWRCLMDSSVKHVLEELSLDELDKINASGYAPDLMHPKRTPAELVSGHLIQQTERTMSGGTGLDIIASFKFRWGLDMKAEQRLRTLNHKDLRYVIANYDKTLQLEDVISEASLEEPDEDSALNAAPRTLGSKAMSRFNRLELIDPLADCAVFGDANLTFSMNLAKHRKYLGHVGRVIATTFEEIETLRERYKEIDESITLLEDHHAEVYHGVDCTRIALDQRFKGMEDSIGAVYYNFPHSGAVQGFFDSHPLVNWRHENLMRLFFRALRTFVKPGGLVKVSSNGRAVGVRYSYIVGGALENEFLHVETMPFMEWHLHRYGRSYGDRRDVYKRPDATNNQSYNAQNANTDMVYCFEYAPTGKTLGQQFVRMPPSLETLQTCKDGPFKNLMGPAKAKLAADLHKRFVTELSGVHVG